jgi:hypothetical protein
MGKKASGKHYTSKGERIGSMKTATRDPAARVMNQLKAWQAGKNVVVTIENPNKNETNKKFIRVNARDIYGDPRKKTGFMI